MRLDCTGAAKGGGASEELERPARPHGLCGRCRKAGDLTLVAASAAHVRSRHPPTEAIEVSAPCGAAIATRTSLPRQKHVVSLRAA